MPEKPRFNKDRSPDQEKSIEGEPQSEEIERKFLIKELPEDLEKYPHEDILQGYLIITKDRDEKRLRKKGNKYFLTEKSGKGRTRTEEETEIDKEKFDSLWEGTEGQRVEKTRYEIPYGEETEETEGTIELDVFRGELAGHLSAEIEFKDEKASDNFVIPKWFGKEVTEDERYKNQNLALHGIPKQEISKQEENREYLGIPVYELKEGVEKAVDAVKEKIKQEERTIIVSVAGGSASGKTSAVAEEVKENFRDALIISMDDYYKGKKFMDAEAEKGNKLNLDQPEALDIALLQKHLAQLKAGKSIKKPIYEKKKSESPTSETVEPKKVIIVEGLFSINNQLKDEGDINIFVDIGVHGRILRRLLRDIQLTGQRPADILKYFAQVVQPMHENYIETTKKNADLIINNEYSPEIEAERSGLYEVQVKFRKDLDQEELRKLGADKLSSTNQLDNYYNPDDRDLAKTGEILRIREEGNTKTLTYKGPKVESKRFRERPKFEFEIDNDTEEAFLNIYGEKRKTIQKERTLYQLNGVVFSIDKVVKIEDGKMIDIGNFVEIRSSDRDTNKEKIETVIKQLGLKLEEGIKEAYVEM